MGPSQEALDLATEVIGACQQGAYPEDCLRHDAVGWDDDYELCIIAQRRAASIDAALTNAKADALDEAAEGLRREMHFVWCDDDEVNERALIDNAAERLHRRAAEVRGGGSDGE